MDEKIMLKAIGNIEDSYVEEADANPCETEFSKDSKAVKLSGDKSVRKGRSRRIAGICAAFAAVFVLGAFLGNSGLMDIGAKSAADEEYYLGGYTEYDEGVYSESSSKKSISGLSLKSESGDLYDLNGSSDILDADSSSDTVSAYQQAEVKLIYTASVSIQSTDFEGDYAALKNQVESCGGYFESSQLSNGTYADDGTYSYRTGNFTVRVPSENYSVFISGIGSGFMVTSLSESTTDVGTQYFDTEQKLATLTTKAERLRELLEKASSLTDIIQLENELSDTEYSINTYQSKLNRYDSLISYSTVDITLTRVSRTSGTIDQDDSFFAVLGRRFASGILVFMDFIENIFYWIAESFIWLVIIAVVIILVIRKNVLGKIAGKIRNLRKR